MRRVKKALAFILSLSIIYTMLPGIQNNSFAAAPPINIYIDNFSGGKLNIRWDSISGARSYHISYHDPSDGLISIDSTEWKTSHEISGLKNDVAYDIRVRLYNDVGGSSGTGALIGEGLTYFIPRISFYATRTAQTREPVSSGGFEIGAKPRLNLKWAMPQVWDENDGVFKRANDPSALMYMQNSLNDIYGNNIELSTINFKINISSNASTLNSGSTQSAVFIDSTLTGYKAYISGKPADTADVYDPDVNGFMNFDLLGRKNLNEDMVSVYNSITPPRDYILPDGEILPGTVYYMNIKPSFKNSTGNNVYAVSVGTPDALNGSSLMGPVPYTYTNIRFQLSKDAYNNVYVKIFKINSGSLDLPRLFYYIEISSDNLPGEWPASTIVKTIDDTFFAPGSEEAITVVSGVGINNELYYKIVAGPESTNASDKLHSGVLNYTLAEDVSKSPVPKGIKVIDRAFTMRTVNVNGTPEVQKTTDVTISWEKPTNWDIIRANSDPDKDIVFHVLINTAQADLNLNPYPALMEEGKVIGYYPVKFRRMLAFSSKDVRENGAHLEYTMKGFNMFKGRYFTGLDGDGKPVIDEVELTDENEDDYPARLLGNKVYYMQMYTTNGANKDSKDVASMSDKSIIVSFTTLSATQRDVPLPKNLRVSKNAADIVLGDPVTVSNYVEIQFDKVDINWNNYTTNVSVAKSVYYDIYLSSRTNVDSFKIIGTSQVLGKDIIFVGADDEQSTSIKAIIRDFSPGTEAYTAFGTKLNPNTTYYFIARTRLAIEGKSPDLQSSFTRILPVTTTSGPVGRPDEGTKSPLAPIDFSIAKDSGGNLIVSGSKVAFSWARQETDVAYVITCTSQRLTTNQDTNIGVGDSVYQSFKATFGNIYLDPAAIELAENFSYDTNTRMCTYTVNKWLFPNRLYYFSIQAIRKTDTSMVSGWISIPVTTTLIDSPSMLEVVSHPELGFFWVDMSLDARVEDFKIYMKGPKDSSYKLLTTNQSTITKDGSVYYARIGMLQSDTLYDVKVYKGANLSTTVFDKTKMLTRDSAHQIEVRWRGMTEYRYELAIKTVDANEYTILQDIDLEEYEDKDGRLLPYYIEKSTKNSTNTRSYYAKIKSALVKLPDGTTKRLQLQSNKKYFIKLRSLKIDPQDTALVSYSKYIGPVSARTEFNQEDYNQEDGNVKQRAAFLDKIKRLEEKPFWRMFIKNNTANKVVLKSDRMVNAVDNNGSYPYALDISSINPGSSIDVVYLPVNIIKALDTRSKSIQLKTQGADYLIRPGIFNLENNPEIQTIRNNQASLDILFKLTIARATKPVKSLPLGTTASSKIHSFDVQAIGSSKTSEELKQLFNDKVYNEKTGLVQAKLNKMISGTGSIKLLSSKEIDEKVENAAAELESELSDYVGKTIEGGSGGKGISVMNKPLKSFGTPLMVRIMYSGNKALFTPYVLYDGSADWQKISANTANTASSMTFYAVKTGTYTVLSLKSIGDDIPDSFKAKEDIRRFGAKYDLSGIFGTSGSISPDDKVLMKEVVNLFEKVMGKESTNSGLSLKQKAENLGLSDLTSLSGMTKEVSRKEAAVVIMRVYSAKVGVDLESLKPRKTIFMKDEAKLDGVYYKPSLLAVDFGVFTLDKDNNFRPDQAVLLGDMISAFVKMLELTGEM